MFWPKTDVCKLQVGVQCTSVSNFSILCNSSIFVGFPCFSKIIFRMVLKKTLFQAFTCKCKNNLYLHFVNECMFGVKKKN